MNNTFIDMEVNKGVKRYTNIKCKLGYEQADKVEEINKCFEQFKEQYRNADTKKEFFRINGINTNDSVIFSLKLILDLFNWGEITIEKINKVAKENKKKPEHLLNTICRRIENYYKRVDNI